MNLEKLAYELHQFSLSQTPYFNTLSQELHLPFSYEEYTKSVDNQASLIHEYTHLVQAISTTHGIFNFIGTTERFIFFLNAITQKNEIKIPLLTWASGNTTDESLINFFEYESEYQKQRAIGDGYWLSPQDQFQTELEVRHISKKIGDRTISRWHIIRKFKDEIIAVPILAHSLCEAQAECVASHFLGIQSPILGAAGSEPDMNLLFYTSISSLIERCLPLWPIHETVFLLTDFALMTFAPDEAFVKGMHWLKNKKVPMRLTDWNELRVLLSAENNLEINSISNLLCEVDKKIKVLNRHPANEITGLFIHRLELGKKCFKLREKDPTYFFPWDRDTLALQEKMLSAIPIPYARFSDGVHYFGNPNMESNRKQAILSSLAFLFQVLEGETEEICPLINDSISCPVERTYYCSQFPWARGDIGNGQLCPQGGIGKILGIDKSIFSKLPNR